MINQEKSIALGINNPQEQCCNKTTQLVLWTTEVAALIALNDEANTATRIAVVEEVNAKLPNAIIDTLRQPRFTYRHDESFAINGYTLQTPHSPFLKLVNGFEESRCAIYTTASGQPRGGKGNGCLDRNH